MSAIKTPTHYFVYTGHGTQTKNKLEKEFKEYLETLQGFLVKEDSLLALKKQIVYKSVELNLKHNRCKPLKVSFEEFHAKTGFRITGFYYLTFNIYKAYHGGV